MADAVDKWQDTHGQRYLGTLFQMATLITLHTQTSLGNLLLFLFQHIVKLVVVLLATVQTIEQP